MEDTQKNGADIGHTEEVTANAVNKSEKSTYRESEAGVDDKNEGIGSRY